MGYNRRVVFGPNRIPRPRWCAALAAALALLCGSGCATDQGAQTATGPIVKQIEIDGTHKVDPEDIRKKLLTSETSWIPFSEKHRFDPTAWQADLRRIERFYQARGFYQAQVVDDRVLEIGRDTVKLVVQVREGLPTTVESIEVRGLEGLPQEHRKKVLKGLPLEVGQPFLEDDWTAEKARIQEALRELGYAEAQVKGEVQVDVATRRAKVAIDTTPGQRYRFGTIFVASGPRPKVAPDRVIEQVKEATQKRDAPEWFSESDLAEAQQRVFKMGVFGGVRVTRGAPDRQAGTVPVVVDVREAPFHTLRAGAGGGADATRWEARGTAEYTNRNFFGDLRRLTINVKAGYAFIPNAISVFSNTAGSQSGVILDSLAELEQPRLFRNPNLRAQVSVGAQRGIEQAYNYFGGRAKVGLIWQPYPWVSVFPSYNFEGYRLFGRPTLTGTTPPTLVFGCSENASTTTGPCNIFLSYLEQVVEWDRRENHVDPRISKLEPTDGYYLSLSLQESGGPLGGSFTYLRILPEVRGYASFLDGDKLTLAGKVKTGTLLPFAHKDGHWGWAPPENSPIVTRFFSGGGNSFRGFNDRRFSPMELTSPQPGNSKLRYEPVPVGGNALVESSFEVRYTWGDFIFAAFLDAGLVTRESLQFSGPYLGRNMQYAVGLGIRYRTLVGPIRVDVARRLNLGGPLEVFGPPGVDLSHLYLPDSGCFGLFQPSPGRLYTYAGSPEGQCTFHLSIGEAF